MASKLSALESLKARLNKRKIGKRASVNHSLNSEAKRVPLPTNDHAKAADSVQTREAPPLQRTPSSLGPADASSQSTAITTSPPKSARPSQSAAKPTTTTSTDDELASLLGYVSYQETSHKEENAALIELLATPSIMEQAVADRFKSQHGSIREFCAYNTAEECMQARQSRHRCGLMHFRKVIKPITDVSLGDCSYLNDCRHPGTCKFVHYEVDPVDDERIRRQQKEKAARQGSHQKTVVKTDLDNRDLRIYPAQWIQCDIRNLDMHVLGKFRSVWHDNSVTNTFLFSKAVTLWTRSRTQQDGLRILAITCGFLDIVVI
eukprot:TRINITY_DN9211_c0_g1_i2.p1 TRINITY_DN9211_c0_g1~~TRINITY_DN9211_c0_g1_i2.p1  ORF type:complete len:352 (+),score=44.98 TRINITY_DN9211_c0_g1_i2:100-1056(+)